MDSKEDAFENGFLTARLIKEGEVISLFRHLLLLLKSLLFDYFKSNLALTKAVISLDFGD